jgi:hypothetical protein
VPVFSSVQLFLYCVGCAKTNFYIGLFQQISYPSDQRVVVCILIIFNISNIDKEINKELPEDDLLEDRNMLESFLKCLK